MRQKHQWEQPFCSRLWLVLICVLAVTALWGKQETSSQEHWWSLQPLKKIHPPRVKHEAWPRSAVDYFVLAKLEEKNLQPSPEADKRTLLRRLHFDLIGLPPTPDEINRFLADDSPDA
ncbi:MAG: DUF1549 domain-containing protein, partial [Verrucomicrobia bacterium]|nr:DUF1549 domain-containing protein [Verrucomicrobiota bacterium]